MNRAFASQQEGPWRTRAFHWEVKRWKHFIRWSIFILCPWLFFSDFLLAKTCINYSGAAVSQEKPRLFPWCKWHLSSVSRVYLLWEAYWPDAKLPPLAHLVEEQLYFESILPCLHSSFVAQLLWLTKGASRLIGARAARSAGYGYGYLVPSS